MKVEYILMYNIEENVMSKWTLEEVLAEINRDRSDSWIDYNEKDWREGWDEWCEGEFYKLLDIRFKEKFDGGER